MSESLSNFKTLTRATSHLKNHCFTQYHKDAICGGKDFLAVFHNQKLQTKNLFNKELFQAQQNQGKLIPIVKTAVTLDRQIIPFRCRRGDGTVYMEPATSNEGNFKQC